MIKNAIKKTYTFRSSYIITAVFFLISMYFYALAVSHTGSLEIFFNETPKLILIAQIFFSILNSLLIGMIMSMVWIIFKEKHSQGNLTFLNAFAALFLSVAATGCYVCGTVLIPVFGVAASFAALPFGGLEVKILTVFLLAYSLYDSSKNVLGMCDIKKPKRYLLKLGSLHLTITNHLWGNLRPVLITLCFIVAIFVLPLLLPSSLKKDVSSTNTCEHTIN